MALLRSILLASMAPGWGCGGKGESGTQPGEADTDTDTDTELLERQPRTEEELRSSLWMMP